MRQLRPIRAALAAGLSAFAVVAAHGGGHAPGQGVAYVGTGLGVPQAGS